MKLYTEEQVKEVVRLSLEDAEKSVIWSKEWYPSKLAARIIRELPSTELPSDEEIQKEADGFYRLESYNTTFVLGAKWMRDQIQGGNK